VIALVDNIIHLLNNPDQTFKNVKLGKKHDSMILGDFCLPETQNFEAAF